MVADMRLDSSFLERQPGKSERAARQLAASKKYTLVAKQGYTSIVSNDVGGTAVVVYSPWDQSQHEKAFR